MQLRYMGHLLREHLGAPTREATFLGSALPNLHDKCRTGGVRLNWIEIVSKLFWDAGIPEMLKFEGDPAFRGSTYDFRNPTHRHLIVRIAQCHFIKIPPF